MKSSRQWADIMEANTDKWFRYTLQPILNQVTGRIASYVGANNASDVVLVENASNAVNAILRSLQFQPGEKMLYLNTAYGMVKATLSYVSQREQEKLVEVTIKFPTTNENIINIVTEVIQNNTGAPIRLASFSHITSVPSVVLPVKELAEVCRKNGILVLIDGAHAMGHIPVNITDINADFYLSNGHKWLFSPKGSAFLWVRSDLQTLIHPPVISDNYGRGFQAEFFWTGTRDYSAMLAMWSALDFRTSLGDEKIMSYIHTLAVWSGHTLASMWNTTILINDSMIGAMTTVQLPTNDPEKGSTLQNILLDDYDTYLVVFPFQEQLFTRVSLQIFNEESDVITLGKRVLQILGELETSSNDGFFAQQIPY